MTEMLFILPIALTFIICWIVFRKVKKRENKTYRSTAKSGRRLRDTIYPIDG